MNVDARRARATARAARPRPRPPIRNLYLGVLLLAMAAGQITNIGGFRDILVDYRLGRDVALLLVVLLVAGELVGGAGLLSRRTERASALVALMVTALWSALALQAFARRLTIDNCGCFGVHLGQPLRWWVLLEDAWFVALAAWVWYKARPAPTATPRADEARAR